VRRLVPLPLLIASLVAAPLAAQLAPPSAGSVADLDRALRRLGQNRRILVIGAHPDDEDTQTLTYVSLALGGEAAYLSLTRGEGGQNAIGGELGIGLGLLRTEELLAARRIDGARQYFTRAFDFGFSKSAEETFRFWPKDSILADVIAVIRRFRPQIIVSVFSGTPRDGHGQHQVSGMLAREAFDSLSKEPGGPVKFYRRIFIDSAATTLTLPTGTLDPAVGLSYQQIAMLSRSQHRSQDFGRLLDIGPATARLSFIASRASGAANGAAGDELFGGVDTRLPNLERFTRLVDSARAMLTPREPSRIVPALAAALAELRRGRQREGVTAEKERILQDALAMAAGVVIDARAEREAATPGKQLDVMVTVWRAGTVEVNRRGMTLRAPTGWQASCAQGPLPIRGGGYDASIQSTWCSATPPEDAPPTQPYFLARPLLGGGVYDWTGVAADIRGEPFEAPVLTARVQLEISGQVVELEREVTYRTNEANAGGEKRWPIYVVPAVTASVAPSIVVWPLSASGGRTLTVTLARHDSGGAEGDVALVLPSGWPSVPAQRFSLAAQGAQKSVTFTLRAPASFRAGTYPVGVAATVNGRRYDQSVQVVSYPHVRPRQFVRDADVEIRAAQIALPSLRRVGYVRGAADAVPEALQQLGVPVSVIGPEELERGNLSAYDAVVIGSRAYEIDPALVANNGRLLDYARAGGLLIVQYQQYEFVRGNFAPFRIEIGRPHDRVTDETAPVRAVNPQSRVLLTPNRIGESDWEGWVQERGLYFARTWDSTYAPVLEMADPASPPLRGGLLVAPVGRGTYVYTGMAFFRQLPAGVPGAYRLFMNLLGLKAGNVQ
jgi:LmbE family N-acetylglucosaminyl deacetylase